MKLRTKFIHKIGAEMEGAFPLDLDGNRIKGFPTDKGDSSVNVLKGREVIIFDKQLKQKVLLIDGGEINSPAFKNKNLLKIWIKKFFPRRVNHTCGFHIHVSLKNKNHEKVLCTQEFHNDFVNDLKNWLKSKRISKTYKKRLSPHYTGYGSHNNFCEGSGAMYFYTHHGTTEFRIFSMVMKPELAAETVDWLFNYIEYWLDIKTKI